MEMQESCENPYDTIELETLSSVPTFCPFRGVSQCNSVSTHCSDGSMDQSNSDSTYCSVRGVDQHNTDPVSSRAEEPIKQCNIDDNLEESFDDSTLEERFPRQGVRVYRTVIAVSTVMLGIVVLGVLMASTIYFTVVKGDNPTEGAHEGNPPVDGIWNDWQAWSDCSATCGNGVMTRNRTCHKSPSFIGNICNSSASDNRTCDNSTICRTTKIACDNPIPEVSDKDCDGNDTESKMCKIIECPVNFSWGSWKAWTDCSTTCGGGIKHRTRVCDNPAPDHNGLGCGGHDFESSSCSEVNCPLFGGWGTWTGWTDCSASCGEGVAIRIRLCDNNAGAECSGINLETKVCLKSKCYDSWGDWSACSFPCGEAIRTRNRTCDGKFTGQECGSEYPTFKETTKCENSESCQESFCAGRNSSCDYKHPYRCDLYVTCGENERMFERACNVLLRYNVRTDDECQGYCDWEDNVQCSLRKYS